MDGVYVSTYNTIVMTASSYPGADDNVFYEHPRPSHTPARIPEINIKLFSLLSSFSVEEGGTKDGFINFFPLVPVYQQENKKMDLTKT